MNSPFLLKPVGKDYLWGGNRLNTDFGKGISMSPLAETWECSTHPDGISIVSSGVHKGELLSDVLRSHSEYIGSHPLGIGNLAGMPAGTLPILIKFIDAKEDLSIQVHPDDDYAKEHENGSLGKTEMWYVLDAAEDSKLIYGLREAVGREEMEKSLADGSVIKYVQKINVHKNDVFYIPAGTIHAIGRGALIAEIQENSNLTYRLYDYERTDKNGNKRQLHTEKALDVANLRSMSEPKQPLRVLRYRKGVASELLARCKYFLVERVLLNTSERAETVEFETGSNSFEVFLCIEGGGEIKDTLSFKKGDCIFAPADSGKMLFAGTAQLLKVMC
ncbi:MAG: class I mannose-6-phosphate isomerase [Lachnospiraceae bacterium]|nr:class I mannose-6-phosphate isomerase [Lachnospiraceae bacterium]